MFFVGIERPSLKTGAFGPLPGCPNLAVVGGLKLGVLQSGGLRIAHGFNTLAQATKGHQNYLTRSLSWIIIPFMI